MEIPILFSLCNLRLQRSNSFGEFSVLPQPIARRDALTILQEINPINFCSCNKGTEIDQSKASTIRKKIFSNFCNDPARVAIPPDAGFPLPPPLSAPDLEKIDAKTIRDAVNSFHPATACGSMGLKSSHLQQLLGADLADVVTTALLGFVRLAARGEVLPALQPFLCGACLTALPKKPSGRRGRRTPPPPGREGASLYRP